MIVDSIENYHYYANNGTALEKGLRFLAETANLSSLKDGRYDIDGLNCYALVQSYETVPPNEKRWESHKDYIDIQFVVSGEEICCYTPTSTLLVEEDLTPKTDLIFYKQSALGVNIPLGAGSFAIFYPHDGHKPGVQSSINMALPVKKIVIKVIN